MKLLYQGPLWEGSTSLQRFKAFAAIDGLDAIALDTGARVGGAPSLWRRVRWKVRIPHDSFDENALLIEAVEQQRPEVVLVDNSRVIRRSTLARLRHLGVLQLVYYSPDDIVSRHNLSLPLKWSLRDWDIVFTTKTFNVPELRALGARNPILIGKAFDPAMHFPMKREEVGEEFERFDAVFIGAHEEARRNSINALAASGVSVVVYGGDKGGWPLRQMHESVIMRNAVFAEDYRRAWHSGKVALCFLRKMNRDRITQRTMEIAGMGRPLVAERTDEHDQHFVHGQEYLGFYNDGELIEVVKRLLSDDGARDRLAINVRRRCENSHYSSSDRAKQMASAIQKRVP